jgi:hypothetical protein
MWKKRLLALAFTVATIAPAFAATTPNSFVSPQTPTRGIVQFLQGTDAAGTYKTLYTASANGSRCYGMWSSNIDVGATHLISVTIVNSAVKYGGVAVTSVVGAGFSAGVPTQNLLTNWVGLPIDQYGNPYIQLVSGDTIQATYATNLNTATSISIVASCSDF